MTVETRRALLQAAMMVSLEITGAHTPEGKREIRDMFDRLLDEELEAARVNAGFAASAHEAVRVLRAVNG